MIDQPSPDAHAAAFVLIVSETIAALRTIPASTRDAWLAELDLLNKAPGGLNADLFVLRDALLSLRLVDVINPALEGGLPVIAAHLTRILHTVPREVRQRWIDQLNVRTQIGEPVTQDECAIAQLLIGLPIVEDLARMIRQTEAQSSSRGACVDQ